jgi:Asp-tRNA(Asn)/Glu-tRNA(Gln) amidotransferase A subunit family amidase
VSYYRQRIETLDQSTRLNAIVVLAPDALAEADRLDALQRREHRLLPLHCVTVIVKDNYETKGLQTAAGSLALKGFLPTHDATMVSLLKVAGAIVIAKSNMAEWAFSPYLTESSIAGVTRNPYDPSRVPAGSSGGTAAAVAAGFGAVGLGSDTGNSIRGPSSHTALVGLRPSIGLTSRTGIVPLFAHNDVGGPMTRSVEDAAILMNVLAVPDPEDPDSHYAANRRPKDYRASLDRKGLAGVRLGVFRRYVDTPSTDPEIVQVFAQALKDLHAAGAEIVDPVDLPDYDALTRGIWCGDFAQDLETYLRDRAPQAAVHSLQEVLASGLYLPANEALLRSAVAPPADPEDRRTPCSSVYTDPPKEKLRQALNQVMRTQRLDALVYPTWSNAPRRVGDLESPAGDNSQILSPQTGWPAITVPMGVTHGSLPAGLTLFGPAFGESSLLRYAYAYEQATRHRRPPDLAAIGTTAH